jgi:hypothetical protein
MQNQISYTQGVTGAYLLMTGSCPALHIRSRPDNYEYNVKWQLTINDQSRRYVIILDYLLYLFKYAEIRRLYFGHQRWALHAQVLKESKELPSPKLS